MTLFSATLRPVTLYAGGSGTVSIVGGDTALSDDTDATYVSISNLDTIDPLDQPTVQFPGLAIPEGAVADFYIRSRFEQVSGTTTGRPAISWQPIPAVIANAITFAGAGDGVIFEDGFWANGETEPAFGDFSMIFPWDPVTPTTWNLGFSFDFNGACDFRLYELALVVFWRTRSVVPARRLYPRTDSHGLGIGRVYPPPNTPQASGRTGSSSPY